MKNFIKHNWQSIVWMIIAIFFISLLSSGSFTINICHLEPGGLLPNLSKSNCN